MVWKLMMDRILPFQTLTRHRKVMTGWRNSIFGNEAGFQPRGSRQKEENACIRLLHLSLSSWTSHSPNEVTMAGFVSVRLAALRLGYWLGSN
jgi:hypothetical protein